MWPKCTRNGVMIPIVCSPASVTSNFPLYIGFLSHYVTDGCKGMSEIYDCRWWLFVQYVYLQSSKAENALRTWRDRVERLFQNHKWLLFFTPVKILEIYRAIQTGKSSRVTQEISFLFHNTTSTWTTLNEAVKVRVNMLFTLCSAHAFLH